MIGHSVLHYLASPYNDPDPVVMEERRIAACRTAGEFIARGIAVFSPIAHNVAVMGESKTPPGWNHWQAFDLSILRVCGKMLVLRLPGWDQSRGVQAEIQAARDFGVPVEFI